MHRHLLISFLFLLLFQRAAHAQAVVGTTPTGSVPTAVKHQEPTLREALHQVARGDAPRKGRALAKWVARQAGRGLKISVR
jgi:hypothetical protein